MIGGTETTELLVLLAILLAEEALRLVSGVFELLEGLPVDECEGGLGGGKRILLMGNFCCGNQSFSKASVSFELSHELVTELEVEFGVESVSTQLLRSLVASSMSTMNAL